jgi:hypothetical protein
MSKKCIRRKTNKKLAKQLIPAVIKKFDNVENPDSVISTLVDKYNETPTSLKEVLTEAMFQGMIIGVSMSNKVKDR